MPSKDIFEILLADERGDFAAEREVELPVVNALRLGQLLVEEVVYHVPTFAVRVVDQHEDQYVYNLESNAIVLGF